MIACLFTSNLLQGAQHTSTDSGSFHPPWWRACSYCPGSGCFCSWLPEKDLLAESVYPPNRQRAWERTTELTALVVRRRGEGLTLRLSSERTCSGWEEEVAPYRFRNRSWQSCGNLIACPGLSHHSFFIDSWKKCKILHRTLDDSNAHHTPDRGPVCLEQMSTSTSCFPLNHRALLVFWRTLIQTSLAKVGDLGLAVGFCAGEGHWLLWEMWSEQVQGIWRHPCVLTAVLDLRCIVPEGWAWKMLISIPKSQISLVQFGSIWHLLQISILARSLLVSLQRSDGAFG